VAQGMKFEFEGQIYSVETLMLSEARAIQKATGYTMLEFEQQVAKGDAECIAAIIWVAQKRQIPTLRFDDVDGDLSTFKRLEDDTEGEDAEAGDQGKDVAAAPPPPSGPSSAAA
jgi:hypothetical protein